MKISDEMVTAVVRELTDRGKLVEAGWVSLRLTALSSRSPEQLVMLRDCFFAGAHHLLSSIMAIMDEDTEPTDDDLKRMDMISEELSTFLEDFKKRHNIVDD